ncbi:MAG TPA: hypothetical protein DCZ94_19535 [Lentisphaeria bacterium]|nr:MAG: hypothetical protein A2X48_23790 [Lentisphaerae bacterium GWF2_49_21]HBC89137.1 hypothetical protein [Lentisphaeria bacterium]
MKDKLLIGWSSRDVTPDKPVNLRGQFHMRIAHTVKDPVTVTSLAVSAENCKNAEESVIWVSCDTVAIPDSVLEMSRKKLGRLVKDFPVGNLVLNATHTHTAPETGGSWHPPVPKGVMKSEEYAEFFTDKVAEAAAESWKSRKHGFIAWGLGYAPVGHGRRAVYFDDLSKRPGFHDLPGTKTEKNARMYGDTSDEKFDCIEGYADHSTHFLFTFDAKKKLTGAVINIACTAQETEGISEISADFWHEARIVLRKEYGKKLFVLPQSSAAGGLSPHLMFNKKAGQRMLEMKGISSRQEIANRIKAAFDDTFSWASKDMKDEIAVKHISDTIELPRRMITEEEYLKVKAGLLELEKIPPSKAEDENKRLADDSVIFARKGRCQRVLQRYEEQKKNRNCKMELHVIRLGDIAIASNSFELFTDYGIRMQARSPAAQTFVVQLCGGGSPGYLPTRLAQKGESYSACLYCNVVGPEGGDILVDETVKRIKSIWGMGPA